ncbi:MAG: glycosyltransferase family 2 protein [Beijerinckiaceae bacterium]
MTGDSHSINSVPTSDQAGPGIDLSIVVPVYRASATIRELYRRIIEVVEARGSTFEILFVEDCGGDDSWSVILALAAEDRRVRGFRMRRNYGQENALLAGIRGAMGKTIATLDDDLQHPPEELPKLLDKLHNDFDVVYGSPEREQHGILRNVASRITKIALQTSMGVEAARHISSFRVFRTNLRDAFTEYRSPSVSIDVLLTWATDRFAVVLVNHQSRQHGESGYDTIKLMRHAVNMTTGFTTLPLRLASLTGFVFAILGMFTLGYVVLEYLVRGDPVPGFPFLASIIALFSGAQLLALGIVGEYLARMYQRSMGKPAYLVSETTELRT